MKNPWKRLSKINPQREDGTRQINSNVFAALVKAKLPTAEMSVVLTIISKTWGFGKRSDTISTSQFVEETGFPGRTIKRVRQDLLKKRIIFFQTSKRVIRGTPLNEYSFNKHYDTWKTQVKKKGVTYSTGVISGKKRVSPATPTKETITKEKELYCRVVDYLNRKTESEFKSGTQKTRQLIYARKNEGFTPDDFKLVIDFKCRQWLGDRKKQEYLRPITLFGSKFEAYLSAAKRERGPVLSIVPQLTPEEQRQEFLS